MRVLIVDDDPIVRQVIRRSLLREGFDVLEVADADAAMATLAQGPIDVVVLDLHLPGTSGLELLPTLREHHPDVHVLMLTGAATEADRVRGLVSGADDYMVKPFSHRELAARVIAVGRRRAGAAPLVVDAGELRIDARARQVTAEGAPVELTRREFDLLAYLAAHPDQNFTRAELLRAVWGSSAEWQSEATVTEHVRRLRLKTEPDPAQPVRLVTVRGSGYRFESRTPALPAGPEQAPSTRDAVAEPLPASGPDLSRVATVVVVGAAIVHANAAALTLVGAGDASDVVGQDPIRFVAPRSHGSALAQGLGDPEDPWTRPEVMSIQRLDGSEVLVEVASTPVLWDEHPATQITLWDLAGDTAKVRELATGIRTDVSEAIIVTDAQMRIQSFNAYAEDLYGWRERDVLGRPMADIVPCTTAVESSGAVREVVERQGFWHAEVVQQRRGGEHIAVRSSCTLLRNDLGVPVGMVWVNRRHEVDPADLSGAPPLAARVLPRDITLGLERGEFVVHYQPVVRLDGTGWGGVETLVRWDHPELGLLCPAEFLPVADQSADLVDLGHVVLAQACAQWSRWQQAGIDLHVTVNLSGSQLAEDDLPDRLKALMAAVSMPPGALWLEVTESALVEDLHGGPDRLNGLAELGAFILLDDFGTGWASLAYLRDAPVHGLKIDRRFVAGLGSDAQDAAVVGSIVSLGLELRRAVIAEGVETVAQVQHLRRLGCELGQGFLFGRPQPAEELERSAWLAGAAPAR